MLKYIKEYLIAYLKNVILILLVHPIPSMIWFEESGKLAGIVCLYCSKVSIEYLTLKIPSIIMGPIIKVGMNSST